MKYMIIDKWIIFDKNGNRVGTKTLRHKNGALYNELEPFEAELKQQKYYAELIHRENRYIGIIEKYKNGRRIK